MRCKDSDRGKSPELQQRHCDKRLDLARQPGVCLKIPPSRSSSPGRQESEEKCAGLPRLLLAFGTLDMTLEHFSDARLISGAGALEPPQHIGIQS